VTSDESRIVTRHSSLVTYHKAMFDDFYLKAHELTNAGVPFATATVVRAERPTSGKPGDKAIITTDGVLYGWIGGSCAQPTVVREALRVLREDASCLIRLSPNPREQVPRAGLLDVALTCFSGGTLEIFIEPQQPRPRLVVVGALPLARSLATLGRAMSYHVIVVDVGHTGAPPAYANEVLTDLAAIAGRVTPQTAIVVATHGEYDEPALEQALRTQAAYIGLVASRRRAESVRDYLRAEGVGEAALRRISAPAGLDIGARRCDEIALSVMSEIVQRRRTTTAAAIGEMLPPQQHEASPAPGVTAIDPVCQMTVEVATAKYSYDYNGTTYYFCCPGCKRSFSKAPEQYLASSTAGMPLL